MLPIEGHIFAIDNRVMKSQVKHCRCCISVIMKMRSLPNVLKGHDVLLKRFEAKKGHAPFVLTGEVVYDSFSKVRLPL